jgi:hypothetical protein
MAKKSIREEVTGTFDPTVYSGDLAKLIEQADRSLFDPHKQAVTPVIVPRKFPGSSERGVHVRSIITYRSEKVTNKEIAALLRSSSIESYIVWGMSVEALAEEMLAASDPWKTTGDAQFRQMLMLWSLVAVRSRVVARKELFPEFRLRTLSNILLDNSVPSKYRAEFFRQLRTIPDNSIGNPRVLDARLLAMVCALALDDGAAYEDMFRFLSNT